MNNPVVLYNLMIHCIEYKEYEDAKHYAEELDKIIGYDYYIYYVENEEIKYEANKDKCLKRYNKFIGSEE
jgi:hypothetical protein